MHNHQADSAQIRNLRAPLANATMRTLTHGNSQWRIHDSQYSTAVSHVHAMRRIQVRQRWRQA
jgi:hypothetical protein